MSRESSKPKIQCNLKRRWEEVVKNYRVVRLALVFCLAGTMLPFSFALQQNGGQQGPSGQGQPQKRPQTPPPGGQKPGGQQPGGQKPGGQKPGGQQPGGQKPGGQQPGGQKPGGQKPGGPNQGHPNPGGTPNRPAPSRPPSSNKPNPGRPSPGRPPQGHYQFRPQDTTHVRRYYSRNLTYINRARRPHFVMGGYIPLGYRGYFTPIPPPLLGYLPPPPPGYAIGYFQGYCVVYSPTTFVILNLIDLLN